MSSRAIPRWTAGELARFLIAPDAGERLSPIDGPGALVLDLPASPSPDVEGSRDDLLRALETLPCVTVAIADEKERSDRLALAEACDVVVSDAAEVESLLAGFDRNPLAALALVQLLRSSAKASIHSGLVAESFVYSTLQSGPEFRAWLAGRKTRRAWAREREGRTCRLDRDRGRLEIRLDRPEKKNAFSRAMRDEFVQALQLVAADPTIEEVVLRGEGDAFCSGGDLDEFGSFPDPAVAHAVRTTRSPAMWMARLGARIRVEVHGACIGAGIELPAFAQRVVADEGSFFQLPEIGLGLVPGSGGTVSLPRRVGRQRTAWLALSGSRIDARTALDWGLVDEVRLGQHVG